MEFGDGLNRKTLPQHPDYSNARKIRLSTLSLPGPEQINQIKMIMYMVSGRYKKSSSQSRNECPPGIVARPTVVIATIIGMMSVEQHTPERSHIKTRQPPMNSTEEPKYCMKCASEIAAPASH